MRKIQTHENRNHVSSDSVKPRKKKCNKENERIRKLKRNPKKIAKRRNVRCMM